MISAALVLSAALLAQAAAPQPPAFRSGVELVQVDVVVVDQEGQPVEGLTPTDFALFDRGRPQAIATFEEIVHRRPEADEPATPSGVTRDTSSNRTARSERLIVMVVDDLHIYQERTEIARAIARQVLADLGPASSMAVLFTSGDHSTPVTQDPARLLAAVETLRGRQAWRRPHPAIDDQKAARIDPEAPAAASLASIQQAQGNRVQDFFENMAQYKTLQDAARLLGAGDARRKAFVLLSEGIGKDVTGLFAASTPQGDVPQGGAAYVAGDMTATMAVAPNGYHDAALLEMMESLRRSNVAAYAIDPRGKVESRDLLRECFPAPSPGTDPCSDGFTDWASAVRQAQHGLEIISAASGGFAVTDTDDFTAGLARIVADLDHYYLLGFHPADPKGKGFRPLRVVIPGHPGWTLRFRRGYTGGAPPPPAPADALTALSAGVLPSTGLPLRLTAVPLPGLREVARVVLALEVAAPRRALQDPDGKVRDTLHYEVLLVDEKKARVRVATGREGKLTLSATGAVSAQPETVAYQVWDTIDIRPGRYEIRVSATSARLGQGGSVYLPIDVPDFTSPVMISGLALDYADGPRVPAAPRAGTLPLPFLPTLDRSFATGETLRVYVEAVNRGARPAPAGRVIPSIEVIDGSGRVVRAPSPSFTSGDPMRIAVTIPLAGLPAGAYVLRASVGEGDTAARRETGFVVR